MILFGIFDIQKFSHDVKIGIQKNEQLSGEYAHSTSLHDIL